MVAISLDMEWDAFITYKSEDLEWAERIYQTLTALGLNVFFDDWKLKAGDLWSSQLETALANSGALVVVWSKKAAQLNTYNDTERFLFGQQELRSPRDSARPVIFVTIDSEPSALGALHHVTDLKNKEFQSVDQDTWQRVGQKLFDGIHGGKGRVPVKTLVLAASIDELSKEELGNQRWRELQQHLRDMNLEANFAQRYEETPRDWRPYGKRTIDKLLKDLADQLLKQKGPSLYFESVDAEFASDNPKILKAKAQSLSNELALIIVDPLSLFAARVERQLAAIRARIGPSRNAIAVLAPIATDDTGLDNLIEDKATEIFRAFYRPDIDQNSIRSAVGLHLRNENELLRVLLLAHAYGESEATKPRHDYNPFLAASH